MSLMNIRRQMIMGSICNITFNLNGLTTSAPDKVMLGTPYTASFTGIDNKQLIPSSVNVIMGDVDITEDVYNDELNQIIIPNVIDNITITAEGALIPNTYTPVLYLYPGTTGTSGTKYRYFDSGLYATEKTTAEMDVEIYSKTTRALLYGASNYNTSPSFCVNASNTGGATGSVFYGNNNGDINHILLKRFISRMSPEGYYYMASSGSTPLKKYTNTLETFTTPKTIVFGGYQQSTSVFRQFYGKIFRFKINENGVSMRDYIPCKRISDGFTGFYDLVNSTFLTEKTTGGVERADWMTPGVTITRALTNVADTMQSTLLNTGRITHAIYGSTWVCKYSPSTNYTFNDSNAVFSVLINGVDETANVATYDNTTDSWTVTLVAHWGDTISVIATTQADENAPLSNPDSINNINPEEEEEI